MPTNKILLEEILKEQRELAVQQLQISSDFSNFMNKQNMFNQRISGLLESDSATNTKGAMEDLGDLKDRVLDLEVKNKITAGKVAISVLIFTAVGTFVLKLLGLFD
jgi:hypothetical protein